MCRLSTDRALVLLYDRGDLHQVLAQGKGRFVALASEEAAMINGADQLVDGGYTAI
tara:strand:+ start:924 stop:1091 length:168 start_codon:yes stop_codon:yes gene_type:complete